MKQRWKSLVKFIVVCLIAIGDSQVSAQTLCGVTGITRGGPKAQGFTVRFDGRKAIKIFINNREGAVAPDPKGKFTTDATNNPTATDAKEGERIYVTEGLVQSCVIMEGERDSKPGFYIEQHIHVDGQPPVLQTEFIEAQGH